MTGYVLFASMIIMLLVGVPISVTLGAATLAALLTLDVPLAVIPQRLFTALDASSIMAIPFFVLAGNFMCEGGISRRLVDFCNSIIGNIRGGMAYAMILACAFFAALSGSAPATVLAIGGMLYSDMVRIGYPADRSAGLLAVAGGLGPIIPPSIVMVVYCTITNSSVGDMFKAGIVAGIIIALVLFSLCERELAAQYCEALRQDDRYKLRSCFPGTSSACYNSRRYIFRLDDSDGICFCGCRIFLYSRPVRL